MSNVNAQTIKEQPISKRFADKRAQLDQDSSMLKEAPQPTPGAIQTHPMEKASPPMAATLVTMENLRQILENQYNAVKNALETGDFSKFIDPALRSDASQWEAKHREYESLLKKLVTILILK